MQADGDSLAAGAAEAFRRTGEATADYLDAVPVRYFKNKAGGVQRLSHAVLELCGSGADRQLLLRICNADVEGGGMALICKGDALISRSAEHGGAA